MKKWSIGYYNDKVKREIMKWLEGIRANYMRLVA